MKIGFQYKEGDIIPVYANWETQDEQIGTAKLLKYIRQGRSFILEDTYPEADQIVYNYQEWIVETKDKIPQLKYPLHSYDHSHRTHGIKIRYIDTIGLSNSADDEESEDEDPRLPKDSFLSVNGKEIF